MIEIKIIEDPQAPLHVGAKRLPDCLRNNLVSSPKAFSLIIQFEGVELTGAFSLDRKPF